MVIPLLIVAIGLLPLVLAINVLIIYKGSELATGLLFFMICISLWQIDIGVLYLKDLLPENNILFLFQLFRIGPTFIVPIIFYITYLIVKKYAPNFKNATFFKIILSIFNKKIVCMFFLWTIGIYFLCWTKLGVEGLRVVTIFNSNTELFFPVYGAMHFLYLLHTSIFAFLLIIIFFLSKAIQTVNLRAFLSTFSFCSILLFITGFLNFIPGTGAIVSSVGVIIFTSIIIFSFIKMNNLMAINFNRLKERQKKLDYTGDIASSLIHEVKNNLQIIQAYSTLLMQTNELPKSSIEKLGMIEKSTKQLDELANSYTNYINKKAIVFKSSDLNTLINDAICITSEVARENRIKVTFERKYKPLKAHVSETYLTQVFINLIKNACESISADNNIRKVTIYTKITGDQIVIDISDTGIGIPLDKWESIFNPFTSSKKNGMGVGLPFTRKIIFEHRGEIKVLDSNSDGTTIRIVLPQYAFTDL